MTANLQAPPVNEVALAVCFEPEDLLAGPLLPEMLGQIFTNRSSIQTVPPYTMPVENDRLAAIPLSFQLQQVMADPRYWITAIDSAYLTQIQTSYVALNWRKQDSDREYVHYSSLRERFVSTVETLKNNLRRHDRSLTLIQAELTYVNVVSPDSIWSTLGEAHEVFKITTGSVEDYEQMGFSFSRRILGEDNVFLGRLHVNMQPGIDPLKEEPRLNLTITARSTMLGEDADAYLFFLDIGHEISNSTFLDILTPAAKANWRLK